MEDLSKVYTERVKRVFELAVEEARRFNHNYLGTEHLLLGLIREGDGIAARVLMNSGAHTPKVRSAVEFIVGRGDTRPIGQPVLTQRATKAIQDAAMEAEKLNHKYLGTEHVLLGLIMQKQGIAAGVLESLDINLEKVRAQVMTVIVGNRGTTNLRHDHLVMISEIIFNEIPLIQHLLIQRKVLAFDDVFSVHCARKDSQLWGIVTRHPSIKKMAEIMSHSVYDVFAETNGQCLSDVLLLRIAYGYVGMSTHVHHCPVCSIRYRELFDSIPSLAIPEEPDETEVEENTEEKAPKKKRKQGAKKKNSASGPSLKSLREAVKPQEVQEESS